MDTKEIALQLQESKEILQACNEVLTTDKYKADKSDEATDKVFNKKNK